MSKNRKRRKQVRNTARAPKPVAPARTPTPDGTYYFGLGVILAFAWFLIGLVTEMWGVGAVVCAAIFVASMSFYALMSFLGSTPRGWKAAMARLCLRFVGYHNNEDGKPLAEAKGRPEARNVTIVASAIGAAVVAGLAFWLVPGLT